MNVLGWIVAGTIGGYIVARSVKYATPSRAPSDWKTVCVAAVGVTLFAFSVATNWNAEVIQWAASFVRAGVAGVSAVAGAWFGIRKVVAPGQKVSPGQ